jgi:hypothetical protein
VKHSHGQTERHDDMEAAWAALRSVYGEEIYAVGPDGWDVTGCETWQHASGSVLVWSDEASSEDDDGQRAVATISAHW